MSLFAKPNGQRRFTADELWAEALKYFKWVEKNPIYEVKPMVAGRVIEMVKVPKPRAMSVRAFCRFLRTSETSFYRWRKMDDLADTCEAIYDVIYDQKFSGAAAGVFNGQIIARDLGLRDDSTSTLETGDALTELLISLSARTTQDTIDDSDDEP